MERFVSRTKNDVKYYQCVLGHKTQNFIHPQLFIPRGIARRKDGSVAMAQQNYVKTYAMSDEQLLEETVHQWTSSKDCLDQLPVQKIGLINRIKGMLTHEAWTVLVVFHDKECNQKVNKYAYGNHLHVIFRTDLQQISNYQEYRKVVRCMSVAGGFCKVGKITGDITTFMTYLSTDDEKFFLGTNCNTMLKMYLNSQQNHMPLDWGLDMEEENTDKPSRESLKFVYSDPNEAPAAPMPDTPHSSKTLPEHLHKQSKAADTVKWLIDLLAKHTGVTDINQLMSKQQPFSETWTALCHLGTSQQGNKSFQLALDALKLQQVERPISEIIRELPDEMDGYMSARHSQAVFNAWAIEQNISPRQFACLMQMIMSGLAHKRIGIYLSGLPNSGKSVITNSSWDCLSHMVGVIVKDNFPLHDCKDKRIIIGEEIGFTPGNLDSHFKDLMSGAKVTFARKGKDVGTCKPVAVLLNSNQNYTVNLDRTYIQALQKRLYVFQGLHTSQIMPKITGKLHPRCYFDCDELTQTEIEKLVTNSKQWDMEPIGKKEIFDGTWDNIPVQTNTPPENNVMNDSDDDMRLLTQVTQYEKNAKLLQLHQGGIVQAGVARALFKTPNRKRKIIYVTDSEGEEDGDTSVITHTRATLARSEIMKKFFKNYNHVDVTTIKSLTSADMINCYLELKEQKCTTPEDEAVYEAYTKAEEEALLTSEASTIDNEIEVQTSQVSQLILDQTLPSPQDIFNETGVSQDLFSDTDETIADDDDGPTPAQHSPEIDVVEDDDANAPHINVHLDDRNPWYDSGVDVPDSPNLHASAFNHRGEIDNNNMLYQTYVNCNIYAFEAISPYSNQSYDTDHYRCEIDWWDTDELKLRQKEHGHKTVWGRQFDRTQAICTRLSPNYFYYAPEPALEMYWATESADIKSYYKFQKIWNGATNPITHSYKHNNLLPDRDPYTSIDVYDVRGDLRISLVIPELGFTSTRYARKIIFRTKSVETQNTESYYHHISDSNGISMIDAIHFKPITLSVYPNPHLLSEWQNAYMCYQHMLALFHKNEKGNVWDVQIAKTINNNLYAATVQSDSKTGWALFKNVLQACTNVDLTLNLTYFYADF